MAQHRHSMLKASSRVSFNTKLITSMVFSSSIKHATLFKKLLNNTMSRLKIVFAGTPEFAVPFVQHLFEDSDFEIVGILTAPDRPVGRKQVLTAPAVKAWAQQRNIPVLQPEKLRGNTEVLEQLQS